MLEKIFRRPSTHFFAFGLKSDATRILIRNKNRKILYKMTDNGLEINQQQM